MKLALLLAASIAVTLTPAVLAQKPQGKGASVRFLAERTPGNIDTVQMKAGELTSEGFKLPHNHLSPAIDSPARAFIIQPTGTEVPLAKVTLPEKGDNFIILLIPERKGGYNPVVISAGDPEFRPGDVYFYNHADKTVLGYVGTSKFILKPGLGKSLHPTGAKDGLYFDVGFGVREKEGDRPLSTTRWPVEKDMRSYVFFFLNPKTERLDFRAVDEYVPPAL